MKVTFCGHAEIMRRDYVESWLADTVETLILEGADTFFLGGYGEFDKLCAAVLRKLRKAYPHIRIILVLAYLNRNTDTSGYDSSLYPDLEDVPLRFAISKRNQRMVDMADVIVAYVIRSFGGAQKTLQYAKKKGKKIISFPA